MTARTTFEDRLLTELQGEIMRRERTAPEAEGTPAGGAADTTAGHGAGGGSGAGAGGRPRTRGPRRRLVTRPRLVIAAGVCALAGFGVTLVPGSPAVSPAYSLEHHDDGSVTFSLHRVGIGPGAQKELAAKLRAAGIHVTIDNLKPGYRCAPERGESLGVVGASAVLDLPGTDAPKSAPSLPDDWPGMSVTMHRGDSLGIENRPVGAKDDSRLVRSEAYFPFKGRMTPCEPERDPLNS
ncbi:hypothetical protein ACIGAN_06710 [Streptomyces sp. NPDC085931]|uniref:hypothetical protein n=1 Tax=Streptomyces sp. NPDC085931 TaxID=3365740 RepID=UPI0037D05D74